MLKSLTYAVKKTLLINCLISEVVEFKDKLIQQEEKFLFTHLKSSIEKINFLQCTNNNRSIKSGSLFGNKDLSYEIKKELLTETYLISFDNVIILHVSETDYPLFLQLHSNNPDMLFASYKYDSFYHVICLSHTRSTLHDSGDSFLEFLHNNYCHPSFVVLSAFFGSFIVLNENYKHFYDRFSCNKVLDKQLRYQQTIGHGDNKYPHFKLVIDFVNSYNKSSFLPTNYLKLPY